MSRRRRRSSKLPIVILITGILAGMLIGAVAGYMIFVRDDESLSSVNDLPSDDTTPREQETVSPTSTPTADDQASSTSPTAESTSETNLTSSTGDGPTIRDVTLNVEASPNAQIPRYEKLEVTFQVDTTTENLQFPYDDAPPPGVRPAIGINVDALFTPDNWETVYTQPAFYYQEFQKEIKEGKEWIYPTGNYSWKVRFAPNKEGEWQFKLTAHDASGVSTTSPSAFTVTPSDNKGFIRVSQADSRYFEYDDGTYFPGLGYNARIPRDEDELKIMSDDGIHLIRTWLPSQLSIFGSAWSPWASFGAAPQAPEPNARLRNDFGPPFNLTPGVDPPIARAESELFLWLSQDETVFDDGNQWNLIPCVVWGWQSPKLPLKQNTNYRIRVRYKEQDLTGPKVAERPYGFTVKVGGFLWDNKDESRRCSHPDAGKLLAASYSDTDNWSHYPDPQNEGWQILEGRFNSGPADFLDNLYLAIENASSGNVFVDYVWLEEDLGNDQFGPNVISKPWMALHQYFDQRNSFVFDTTLDLAKQYDIYFKLVILEKNDYALNIFEPDGTLSKYLPSQNPKALFFGDGREVNGKTKTRWLQEAWWRYLQARWGYSPNIHSWELLNEGDPGSRLHYMLADEMGKYFRQAFIPQGQQAEHPDLHLVTTSFWSGFPVSFWGSADYPYIDYADIHHYFHENDTKPLDYIYDISDFYDAALVSQKLSMVHGAKQPEGPGKPVVRGETGFIFADTDLFSQNATQGLWLHNFIWAGINSGGLIESYWTGAPIENQIRKPGESDHRPVYKSYVNFISGIPLNNGHYQDAAAEASQADLRVWGQKDVVNGQAHLWIQNKNHTWKNVVDDASIPAITGTVTISGFQPGESYTLQWWDPYQPDPAQQIINTETLAARDDGSLSLAVDNLVTDVAVKIVSP